MRSRVKKGSLFNPPADKQTAVTALSFLVMAFVLASCHFFDFPAVVIGERFSNIWLPYAFNVAVVLVIGAVTTSFVSRLSREQADARRELDFQSRILDAANDSIFAFRLEGSLTYVNEKGCLDRGYSREEILRLNRKDLITADHRGLYEQRVDRLKKEGELVFEAEHVRKDASIFPVEVRARYLRLGEEEQIITVCRDITERRMAEKAVQSEKENFRMSLETSPMGIQIVDPQGNTLFANRKMLDLWGVDSLEEYSSRSIEQRYTPESARKMRAIMASERDGFHVLEYDVTIVSKKQELRDLHAFCNEVLWNGNLCGLITYEDVTERKRLEQQLIMADRLATIGELAAGVAHELNNPLTAVIGFSQMLAEDNIPVEIKEQIKIIDSEAQRAARIVKDLLAFSRKHKVVSEFCQVNHIFEEVLRLRDYEHKVNNITVITDLAPDLPEIKCDRFQIQQVLLNIIINAEYFMLEAHQRGVLSIATEHNGSHVRLIISDDGPGIKSEYLPHIFDPFFTTKEVGRGTGLGLSICHGIIKEHNGRIHAESQPGKGATIIVELPVNS